MTTPQRFRYPKDAIFKDYAQAAAGVLIFGTPLVLAGGNLYVTVILGGIVLMFLGFAWTTWRRHKSVIVVTDDAIGSEGAQAARISWQGMERVQLRYFASRRVRSRDDRGQEGKGWMQLRLDGEGAVLKIDSALDDFEQLARHVAEATQRYGIRTAPATKSNFAALGLAPDRAWAEEA